MLPLKSLLPLLALLSSVAAAVLASTNDPASSLDVNTSTFTKYADRNQYCNPNGQFSQGPVCWLGAHIRNKYDGTADFYVYDQWCNFIGSKEDQPMRQWIDAYSRLPWVVVARANNAGPVYVTMKYSRTATWGGDGKLGCAADDEGWQVCAVAFDC